MSVDAREHLELQSELHHAAALGQLRLHYQPKLDCAHGELSGVEALIRWQHPKHGLLYPGAFLPLAERSGLIKTLGDWVIQEACRQMRAWADAGLGIPTAINLSPVQLRDAELPDRIAQALSQHQIPASHLLCEITESVAMDDVQTTQGIFERLHEIGVYLSIDDFGIGHSSLSYLRQLPARQLKIDRSFVVDIESNTDARAVVDAVVKLAHALDLRVIAEGVETTAQKNILCSLGCDELQGFLFAKPMPAEMLTPWIKTHERRATATA